MAIVNFNKWNSIPQQVDENRQAIETLAEYLEAHSATGLGIKSLTQTLVSETAQGRTYQLTFVIGNQYTTPEEDEQNTYNFQYFSATGAQGIQGIPGAQGIQGIPGAPALMYLGSVYHNDTDPTANIEISFTAFSRTPNIGDSFIMLWVNDITSRTFIAYYAVSSVSNNTATCTPTTPNSFADITGADGTIIYAAHGYCNESAGGVCVVQENELGTEAFAAIRIGDFIFSDGWYEETQSYDKKPTFSQVYAKSASACNVKILAAISGPQGHSGGGAPLRTCKVVGTNRAGDELLLFITVDTAISDVGTLQSYLASRGYGNALPCACTGNVYTISGSGQSYPAASAYMSSGQIYVSYIDGSQAMSTVAFDVQSASTNTPT